MRRPSAEARATERQSTLDPEDWEAFRALGREIVDEALSYLETVRERPVWQPVPVDVKERLRQPLPRSGIGSRRAYEEFRELILPHPYGNIHPRFWAWVNGTGTPFTVLAELLAATLNPNVYGSDSVPFYVEHQVLSWLKEFLGYPVSASGVLVSGGSVANLTGLAVALRARAEVDVAQHGLAALPRRMLAYASEETHHSVDKAITLLGLGRDSLRRVRTTDEFTLDVEALRHALAQDRRAGHLPFCVVANAGTVNTGSFDPIDELADLCEAEDLWLHVDGAFGAFAAASPRLNYRVRGLERADSLAFDMHKWLYMPIDVGCLFVRDRAAHRQAFAAEATYLAGTPGGLASSVDAFGNYSFELSRRFRALKIWLGLKEQGADRYVASIEDDVDLADHLRRRVEHEPALELLAPVPLNVVCLRHRISGLSESELDDHNGRLLIAVQEGGVAAPSLTMVRGHVGLRVAITNHRTRSSDLDLFVDDVLHRGALLSGQSSPA